MGKEVLARAMAGALRCPRSGLPALSPRSEHLGAKQKEHDGNDRSTVFTTVEQHLNFLDSLRN